MSDRKRFAGVQITLDGANFENCVFEDCEILYFGLHTFSMVDCTFLRSPFRFAGPAANAIMFMSSIYGMEGQGKDFVEQLFASIRGPKPPEDVEREVS